MVKIGAWKSLPTTCVVYKCRWVGRAADEDFLTFIIFANRRKIQSNVRVYVDSLSDLVGLIGFQIRFVGANTKVSVPSTPWTFRTTSTFGLNREHFNTILDPIAWADQIFSVPRSRENSSWIVLLESTIGDRPLGGTVYPKFVLSDNTWKHQLPLDRL